MPCHDSWPVDSKYDEQRDNTRKLYVWALEHLGRKLPKLSTSKDYSIELCGLLKESIKSKRPELTMHDHHMSRKLAVWWDDHHALDVCRDKLTRIIEGALSKLNHEEVEALKKYFKGL